MKAGSIFLMLLMLVIGFFAGQAWKGAADNEASKASDESQQSAASSTQDSVLRDVRLLTESEQATIRLFEEAAPSVAFITSINLQRDYWTRNVMEIPQGSGSGFVWDSDGHVVTNFHVISGGHKVNVTLSDQSTWPAKLIGAAPEKDLAVLKIEAPRDRLKSIGVGTSSDLRVGQFVFAIGNPFGLDHTLTTGVISALGREIQSLTGIPIRDAIQTDAAINPGNSGGPLLDSSGKLVGVNTQIYSPSGANAGIGFAIPVDEVKWVVSDLIEFGELRRPVLGVELVAMNTTTRMGLKGALVLDVTTGGAAEQAGIRPTRRSRSGEIELGDLIVGINDQEVASNADLILSLEKFQPGEEVTITLIRNDNRQTVVARLQGK
jgi:S1-C subfamily serine protease